MKRKKAFVTGAAGFIGSKLIRDLLNKDFKVIALVRPDENLNNISNLKIEILTGDLSRPVELEKILPDVDYVFHLAALLGEGRMGAEFVRKVNVEGSKVLIDHYVKNGGNLKRFVFISSAAAGGPSGVSGRHDELSESNPISVYGETKLETENYLMSLQQKIPFSILRLPLIYGPMNRRGTLTLFKLINKRIQLINLRNKFSVGFVDDITQGIIKTAESDISLGKKYYIGEDTIYSTNEIMCMMAKALNKKPFKIIAPYRLIYSISFIIEKTLKVFGKSPALSSVSIQSYFKSNWCVNPERAKKELKYKTNFPLEKGIKITVDWYKSNGYL